MCFVCHVCRVYHIWKVCKIWRLLEVSLYYHSDKTKSSQIEILKMCSEGEQNDFVSPTLIRSGDFLTNKGKIGFFRRGIVYKRDFHGITFLEWSNFPELLPFPSKLEKFFHCPQYFLPIINQILMRQKYVKKSNHCDTHSMVNVWYAWNDRILNSKLFLDIRVTDR